MKENYSEILESYLIPAEEGIGLNILKGIGKGVGKTASTVAKVVGVYLGLSVALAGTVLISNSINNKRHMKRYANPTPEEQISRDNYNKTWLPAINEFKKSVADDINKFDKKVSIKKFLSVYDPKSDKSRGELVKTDKSGDITVNGVPVRHMYDQYVCSLKWETLQYEDADGDDEGNPELVREFSEKLSKMKPYVEKWKSEARKFSPYFELVIEVDEPDDDYYFTWFRVVLKCNHIDRDGILKPGLPEFNK